LKKEPKKQGGERQNIVVHVRNGALVFARLTIASQDDKFAPAALVNDVSSTPGPGRLKQMAAEPLVDEELGPLTPPYALQTLFE